MKDFSEALITEYSVDTELKEKWYTGTTYDWDRLWYSDSINEFRAFLQNTASTGIKGLRICVAPGIYLAARALDLNHDSMLYLAKDLYLIESTSLSDYDPATCGFPKYDDFDKDNFENDDLSEEDPIRDTTDFDRRYASYKGNCVLDPITGEFLWTHDGKSHELIADCGTFEVALYAFYSQQFPEFKYGDTDNTGLHKAPKRLFEASELYKVLKPLIKTLYITNL